MDKNDLSLARTTKESIFIRVNQLRLDKNIEKYHLSHVWDHILYDIPELKFKKWQNHI